MYYHLLYNDSILILIFEISSNGLDRTWYPINIKFTLTDDILYIFIIFILSVFNDAVSFSDYI
jgi:hypothetical protein